MTDEVRITGLTADEHRDAAAASRRRMTLLDLIRNEEEPTVSYVVIENTPGYLPEDDDPATFEDHASACEYLRERVESYAESVEEGGGWPSYNLALADWVIVYDAMREHDLGRVFEIVESEES